MRIYLKSDEEYKQEYYNQISELREKELIQRRNLCITQLNKYENLIKEPKNISKEIYADILESSLKWVNDPTVYNKCARLIDTIKSKAKDFKNYKVTVPQIDPIEEEIDKKLIKSGKISSMDKWIQTEKRYVAQKRATAPLTTFINNFNVAAPDVNQLIAYFDQHLKRNYQTGAEGYSLKEEKDILKNLIKKGITMYRANTDGHGGEYGLWQELTSRIADRRNRIQ